RPVSDVLQLSDWSVLSGETREASPQDPAGRRAADGVTDPAGSTANGPLPLVGPLPYSPAEAGEGFSIPDLLREFFWELPAEDHDFISTNRALTQSSQHRILFHAAWRQPMTRLNASTPIAVVGGRAYNDRHELEGSLRLYFNNN